MKLNDGRVVPAFLDQALQGEPITIFGDGSQTRSFCYVSDLVDGLYRLMLSDEVMPGQSGQSARDDDSGIRDGDHEMTGSKSRDCDPQPLPEDDPKQRRPDIRRLGGCWAGSRSVSLEEGCGRRSSISGDYSELIRKAGD
jgi:dTDP-glucose 4,6-dehydratase